MSASLSVGHHKGDDKVGYMRIPPDKLAFILRVD